MCFDPELKVKSGDIIRYKVTAFYEDDVMETEWKARKLYMTSDYTFRYLQTFLVYLFDLYLSTSSSW